MAKVNNRYKYISLPKLLEIRDSNNIQQEYEDKYFDVMDMIEEAISLKLDNNLDKELKAHDNFTTNCPYTLILKDSKGKILDKNYVLNDNDLYNTDTHKLGDIFDINSLIKNINNIINPLTVELEEN